ncbi:hypothetical protein D3C72_1235870 [compost metagenome]
MFRAAGQVRVAGRDFMRAHVDFIHATAHRRHRARQAFLHALQGGEQLADFIGVAHVHPGGQVTARDAVEVLAGFLQGQQHAAAQEDIGGEDQQRGDHATRAHGHQHELVTHLRHVVRVHHLAGAPEIKGFDGARKAPFQRVLHRLNLLLVGRHVGLFQGGDQRVQALLHQHGVGRFNFLQRLDRVRGLGQRLVVLEFRLALVHGPLGAFQQPSGFRRQALRQQGGLAHVGDDVRIVGGRRAAQAAHRVLVAGHDPAHRVIQFLRLLDLGQGSIADAQGQHAKRRPNHQHE